MAEQILRQVAYKVYISDILNNAYVVQQGEWEPNYVDIAGKKVSRVNIIANVVDKQDTERLSSAQAVQTQNWSSRNWIMRRL